MGAGSTIPLLGLFFSRELMMILVGALAALALILELARFTFPTLNRLLVRWFSPLLKDVEEGRVTGATYLILAALLAFILFDKYIAVTALFLLSLGDPMAALVGSRAGGLRLFGKSPQGSAAFVVVGLGVTGVLSMTGPLTFQWALTVGVIIAAIVELLPLPLDDNVTVPLIGGGAMTLLGV